jgi:hydroxymethylpyrimidine/phosphomethylpyrimidine kinase
VSEAPALLVCSGLDPSGGAGMLADVAVARALGTRPVGVVTALTVQSTAGVTGCTEVDAELLLDQVELLLSDVEVRAVKIGMLAGGASAGAIAEALRMTEAPVVWDPILAPTLGAADLIGGLSTGVVAALAPHLTLITPNMRELAHLAGPGGIESGKRLAQQLGCAVLVKGGHSGDRERSVDTLIRNDRVEDIVGKRIPGGEQVHGTGCALATAIAAYLARGAELVEACRLAKQYVAERIAAPVRPGRGAPAVV